MGGIGVITELSLGIERAFTMTQEVFEKLPFLELEANFAEIMSCGYSVSLFTHWTSSAIDQVWVKRRVDGSGSTSVSPADFGAVPARRKLSPLPNGDPENCTEQMGIVGPWYDRLPHFRFGFTPSSGEELQTEYFVPFESAWKALKSIDEIRDRVAPLLQTTEVRTIAGDSLWMSPFRDRPSVAIHFTWKKDWEAVQRLLPTIEGLLAPFGGRPHWGKLSCFCSEQYRELYPALPEFKALLAGYDPCGKFRNSFLDLVLGG